MKSTKKTNAPKLIDDSTAARIPCGVTPAGYVALAIGMRVTDSAGGGDMSAEFTGICIAFDDDGATIRYDDGDTAHCQWKHLAIVPGRPNH